MLKQFLLASLLVSASIYAVTPSNSQGAPDGKEAVYSKAYSINGPDGFLFLDKYIQPGFVYLKDRFLLDVGCGVGFWSMIGAQKGAHVCGIDLQPALIEIATKAAHDAGLADLTTFAVGNVADLPYRDNLFDMAISINLSDRLPSKNVTIELKGSPNVYGLSPHCHELARVIKSGGTAILAAPSSYGVVFTNGTNRKAVDDHINEVLAEIDPRDSVKEIALKLMELKEVYRATFAVRSGRFCLITDESELTAGEVILRKHPGFAMLSFYHSEQECLDHLTEAGFQFMKIERPCFKTAKERLKFLSEQPGFLLGEEYVGNNPFVIFYLKKK